MLAQHVEKLWGGLTRELTPKTIKDLCHDSKVTNEDGKAYYYVPSQYYEQAKRLFPSVEVVEYVRGMPTPKHGLMSLEWENGKPLPYVVPGGRFNEMYGWDSYFIVLGMLASKGDFVSLAANMVRHFCFEIENYGQVLNANRSYYLNRSQPPFLTSMAKAVYAHDHDDELYKHAIRIAIKEYETVWACEPRMDPKTGLSRYRPAAPSSIPVEVEPGHFDHVLEPYAKKAGLSIDDFKAKFNSGDLKVPELAEYLRHDLGVRESGYDTSTRLHNKCGDLATVDLNCLLYKYETDIAHALEQWPELGDAKVWQTRAAARKSTMNEHLWNEKEGTFLDYNTQTHKQELFVNATCVYALWSGLASKSQAERIVVVTKSLERAGGIVCTKPIENQERQWDWPSGWAPIQIMAWVGLEAYGYPSDATRMAQKWKDMITAVYEEKGLIFEKYNVEQCSCEVGAEYGNQGTFSEGFGWTNASILLAEPEARK